MNRAEIYLEDDGLAADVRFVFPNGYDKDSPSHRMCNIVRNMLDEHFAQQGEGDAVLTNPQQALDLAPPTSLIQVN